MDTTNNIPVDTRHLFPVLNRLLIELLVPLTEAEWNSPTIAKRWTVKDIAAHLLDGHIRGIATMRDGYFEAKPDGVETYADLVAWINQRNHCFTDAARRISPRLLVSLLETTGQQLAGHLQTADPFAKAVFGVAWAGEESSANWFHIAREYTEFFLHQQQIRHALHRPGLFTKELFVPFISTIMYGLPFAFRRVAAPPGTAVAVVVASEAGGKWGIVKGADGWQLAGGEMGLPASTVTMQPDTAWQLFSKGITPQEAMLTVQITGDGALGRAVLQLVAVMA
jgi:uncharacterized protein (TIGR03083 family)